MSVGVNIMPHLFFQSSMVPMSLALSAVCVNASLELATAVLERQNGISKQHNTRNIQKSGKASDLFRRSGGVIQKQGVTFVLQTSRAEAKLCELIAVNNLLTSYS